MESDDPTETAETAPLPRIAIIGGGLVGCSILYHLVRAGLSNVVLIEAGTLAGSAVAECDGNLHLHALHDNMVRLQARARTFCSELAEETGEDLGISRAGGLFLARTDEHLDGLRHHAGRLRGLGIEVEMLSGDELAGRLPDLDTAGVKGALFDAYEISVDPAALTRAMANAAVAGGAEVRENVSVTGIMVSPDGWQVATPGEVFGCAALINAAGIGAGAIAAMAGHRLAAAEAHSAVIHELAAPAALPAVRDPERGVVLSGAAARRAAMLLRAADDPTVTDTNDLSAACDQLRGLIPGLGETGAPDVRAELLAPDLQPLAGAIPGLPMLYVACGLIAPSAQAPGIGRAVADLVKDGRCGLDLRFADPARFGDWASREWVRSRVREAAGHRFTPNHLPTPRTGRDLRRSVLHMHHIAAGASMEQVNGWERPAVFAQAAAGLRRGEARQAIGRECEAVRDGVGLIDMSAHCKFVVDGPGAEVWLGQVCSADLPVEPGTVAVSLLLDDRAGIVGDVLICQLAPGRYYLTGPAEAENDYQRWFRDLAEGHGVNVRLVTSQYAALALAGPRSRELLQGLSDDDFSPAGFRYLTAREVEIGPVRCVAFRVSRTGALGWELHLPPERMLALYEVLHAGTIKPTPVGSHAVDCLRIEKGYRGYGSELSPDLTPDMAGLQHLCAREKSYIGHEAAAGLRVTTPERRLATLAVDGEVDCTGAEPVFAGTRLVGRVRSGGYGWRTDQSLVVALVESGVTVPGTALTVEFFGERCRARVLAEPCWDPSGTVQRS